MKDFYRCFKCKIEKPISMFCKSNRRKDGHEYQCKDCKKEYDRKRRNSIPNYSKAMNYRLKYGLTLDQVEEMALAQKGQCAICERERPLNVDHCHSSGQVRGLLCMPCNTVLGKMNDDIKLLERAIAYLQAVQPTLIGEPIEG